MTTFSWSYYFGSVMVEVFTFLSHKWDIFGYQISFLNCFIVAEAFNLTMDFIGRIFGHEEVHNYSDYYE